MSASAVLWPTDTLYDVQGLCCFNAQTCSGFSLHSPNLESSTQSAATCSNPVITGPSVPCKNHNWNHLSICFLFSSPKLLHGQCDICKCNSGAPTEASFFFLNKCWQFGSHHICLVPWATERWGAVKNGCTLSIRLVYIKIAHGLAQCCGNVTAQPLLLLPSYIYISLFAKLNISVSRGWCRPVDLWLLGPLCCALAGKG